ncbi:ABC transporter ATP-binding protein [Krasilnikovia sp. MM14-A1004]|uniref:ABC transporter ATP-binding protein n=1 Tax=Krasilnikovia sp. MM14-A1004 TaxID=3373541 RepID=UPI00399C6804
MILSAANVSVSLGGRVVLDEVSLQLAAGDQAAVTGRSGSGKTTLLLVLAGLIAPSAGTIDLRLKPDEIVYVPQAPSLVPELTALQNATLGLRIRGIAPAEAAEHAREHLASLGLDDVDDALPAELSGGMQQRVALARALAVGPRLLLADEPTAALDQTSGGQTINTLSAYASSTATALVVATHDPTVAAHFPAQVAIAARTDQELVR